MHPPVHTGVVGGAVVARRDHLDVDAALLAFGGGLSRLARQNGNNMKCRVNTYPDLPRSIANATHSRRKVRRVHKEGVRGHHTHCHRQQKQVRTAGRAPVEVVQQHLVRWQDGLWCIQPAGPAACPK